MSVEEVGNDQLDENRESRLTNLGEIYGLTLSEIYEEYNRNAALKSNLTADIKSAQPGLFDRFLDPTRPTAPDLMSEADYIFRDKMVAILAEKDITAAAEELPNLWKESVKEAKDKE